jgi:hypothetical protein
VFISISFAEKSTHTEGESALCRAKSQKSPHASHEMTSQMERAVAGRLSAESNRKAENPHGS